MRQPHRQKLLPLALCATFLGGQAHAGPGDLDPTFGAAGRVRFDQLGDTGVGAVDMLVQPDGKIVVLADTPAPLREAIRDLLIIRYNTDGSLDTGFNRVGYKLLSVNVGSNVAGSIAQLPDGKLLVGGSTELTVGDRDFMVTRLNADGSIDASFGAGGTTSISFGTSHDQLVKLLLQTDGKIVAVGTTAAATGDFIATRLTSVGALDTAFGTQGKVTIDSPTAAADTARSALLQADGRIVIAGDSGPAATGQPFIARLNTDGTLDSSFGSGGRVLLDLPSPLLNAGVNQVVQQADGQLLLGGGASYTSPLLTQAAALARLTVNGAINQPITLINSGPLSAAIRVHDLLIEPNGQFYASGMTLRSPNAFVTRFTSFGVPDAAFADAGTAYVDGQRDDIFQLFFGVRLARQNAGRIVVLGRDSQTFFVGGDVAAIRSMFLARLTTEEGSSAGVLGLTLPLSSTAATEGAGTGIATVVRSGGKTGAVSVDYAAVPITATPGADYVLASGTLSWADGDSSLKLINFTLPIDAVFEPVEKEFRIVLSNATGGATLARTGVTVSIRDPFTASTSAYVSMSRAAVVKYEDSPLPTFQLDVPWNARVDHQVPSRVDYSVLAGTAIEGVDYVASSGTLELTGDGGTKSGVLTIPLIADAIDEPSKTFTVRLSNPVGVTLEQADTLVTVVDNDAPSVVEMKETARRVSETAASISLTVTRTAHSSTPVSVDFATQNGTAGNSDFVAASGTLSWAADDYAPKSITISLSPDATQEADETFTVALSNSSGAELGLAATTVTIAEEATPPSPPPPSSGGGGSNVGGGGSSSGGGSGGSVGLLGLLFLAFLRRVRAAGGR